MFDQFLYIYKLHKIANKNCIKIDIMILFSYIKPYIWPYICM